MYIVCSSKTRGTLEYEIEGEKTFGECLGDHTALPHQTAMPLHVQTLDKDTTGKTLPDNQHPVEPTSLAGVYIVKIIKWPARRTNTWLFLRHRHVVSTVVCIALR